MARQTIATVRVENVRMLTAGVTPVRPVAVSLSRIHADTYMRGFELLMQARGNDGWSFTAPKAPTFEESVR